MSDHVDRVLAQWAAERPDLDSSPVAVVGRLSRVTRAIEARIAENFTAHGIDSSTYDVLATLRRSGAPYELTAGELQRSAMISSAAVAQRLNRVEARGFVTRTPDDKDGRVTRVRLTPAGEAMVDAVIPSHLSTEQAALEGLNAAEREQLARLLAALLAGMGVD